MLEAHNLSVRRSAQFRLEISDLEVADGHILCVAGPNGGGKTTLLDCLTGMLQPDRGAVYLAGHRVSHDLRSMRAILGLIPDDEAWLIGELTAQEYFALLASTYERAGVHGNLQQRAQELSRRLDLKQTQAPLEQLSHGNKKKVQLVAALMHQPRVLIVDELRNGLDPRALQTAEALLQEAASGGTSIVAATHDLDWAERMADHMLFLVDGKPVVKQSAMGLILQYGSLERAFRAALEQRYAAV